MSTPRFRRLPMALLLLGLPSLALAHAGLVRSTPTAGATVAPTQQVELQFNERVMPRATRIELSMAHGRMQMAVPSTSQDVAEDGHTLRVRFAKPLSAGDYRLQWRAVGEDNHPMTGEYRFRVK